MRTYEPLLDLQDELTGQLQHSLQLGIINAINGICDGGLSDLFEKVDNITSGTKVTQNIFGNFYKLCQSVKKKLEFDEDVDFYIVQNPTANAGALLSRSPGMPHIIRIHSALFNLMNEKEMMCIVGHELGHLINRDGLIGDGVSFVYPDVREMPLFLKKRLDLYDLLAELSADRFGYLACQDLESSIRTMYKLSSGLEVEKFNISLEDMLKESDEQLNFLRKEGFICNSTHPYNQIRVKALDLFANAKTDAELDKGMNELINLLHEFGGSDADRFMMDFIVSGGIKVMNADKHASRLEKNLMIERLGELTWAPDEYIDRISKKDLDKVFKTAAQKLFEQGREEEMIHYLVDVALADGRIEESEVTALFDLGNQIGVPNHMTANAIAKKIREEYRPLGINLNNPEPESQVEELDAETTNGEKGDYAEYENTDTFKMHVNYKFTARERKLVLIGDVEHGGIKIGDSVLLSNGRKTMQDYVIGVISGCNIVDSSDDANPNEEFGIMLGCTGSRAINGEIEDWVVQSAENL